MPDDDWHKLLSECFDSTIVASLATDEQEGPYVCPVYFVYDDKLNIYFISSDTSRHIKNLEKNKRVCVSIYDPQKAIKNVQVGVQIVGTASEVPEEMLETVYKERTHRITGITMFSSEMPEGHFLKAHHGVFVMVKPAKVYYVNTDKFGSEVINVPTESL